VIELFNYFSRFFLLAFGFFPDVGETLREFGLDDADVVKCRDNFNPFFDLSQNTGVGVAGRRNHLYGGRQHLYHVLQFLGLQPLVPGRAAVMIVERIENRARPHEEFRRGDPIPERIRNLLYAVAKSHTVASLAFDRVLTDALDQNTHYMHQRLICFGIQQEELFYGDHKALLVYRQI